MSAKGFTSQSSGSQLQVERLENRCLLAVMADGVVEMDARFADDELAICEYAPAVLDEEYVAMVGDASEAVEELAYVPGSDGDFEGELEKPYFVDSVMETDEPFIVCTLYDGPVESEIFMTMTGVDDGEWTNEEWVEGEIVTLGGEEQEIDNWDEEAAWGAPIYTLTGVLDESTEGEEYSTEVIEVVDAVHEDGGTSAEGKEPLEWVDYEGSGPIIHTMMPEDSGEEVRGDDAELPVDEVAEDPVIITMMPEDSGEIVKGEDSDSSEGEVGDPVIHTMEHVDVVGDRETPAEPVSEVEDPEIVTFGNDGEAAENGPVVEVAEEVPIVPVNRPQQIGRPQRDGRNRGIMPLPMLPPGVEPPVLVVVTRMDNRGRLHEVQVDVSATDSRDAPEHDLEPLDAAFSLLRGGRLSQRLGGLR